jgi:ubiquinone/menaquinone biosynthesis C-methylase UbiE
MFKKLIEFADYFFKSDSELLMELLKSNTPRVNTMQSRGPEEGMTKDQLHIAVEAKARKIYEVSRGTPRECYESEALGMILDETNGYHIKPQIKRVHTILNYAGTGKKILDCAGGSGYIANLLQEQGNDVTVLDTSEIHLLRAKWYRGLKTAQGRVESLPFPDHSFDIVLMAEVLEHCENLNIPLGEAERVCREDGQILITVPVCDKQTEYGEHLKNIKHTFIDDETHNNEMLVLSIKNILPHLQGFRDRNRGYKSNKKIKWSLNSLNNLIIDGMHGLGDNIGQRNFIKELPFPVYLKSPWPQLYKDLPNVKILECDTDWRTQKKNLKANAFKWAEPPTDRGPELSVGYRNEDLQGDGSIFKAMSKTFGGIIPRSFDIPKFDRPDFIPVGRKVALIRPVIQRKEWLSSSRNPDPKYVYEASAALKEAGFFVISVCDKERGEEWIEGKEPLADLKFHKGELKIEELLGLAQNVDAMVGGNGMLVHLSLATKTPALIIVGGYLGCNAPEKIADGRYCDNTMITWAIPDEPCYCQNMGHQDCSKSISNFPEITKKWLDSLK